MFFRTTNITPHGNASRVEDLHAGLCSLSHVGHVLKSMIKKCLTQSAETMHNWARYLIFFQYTGTKYSGVVKVPPHQLNKKGVQDHLEDAIRRLKPINPVHLSVSSRTDTGVHALSNSAHFDLHRKNDRPPFTEDVLVLALNNHLREEQIRVTRAHRVPDDFHARYRAQSRTYVYRVALGFSHHTLLPLTESELCWHIPDTKLDVGAMREAAALLVGNHDFSSFRAVNSDMHLKDPVKTLDVASIQTGSSFVQAHFHREISFLELTFRSRSFLYRQVRRMTGALVAVGQGRISVPQLQEILEARDSLAYPYHMLAPARGLFLTRVEYRETDLQLSQQTSEE
ncbi:tRNA pseudouridine synthase-like 1 isoform X1 [Centropristis striata]|uniref:tRNA pseudouridine synthase-like 1 isoform X1 n=1 Tax=Centropristis striata TaxID=184440 RepID=UPI0027DEB703|nr:tRNA pseudouridine synthase-like 1 isoform X1 [Centropristis striata]XP_059186204.1 tRNA pseudouridine synthase-like 1 isoform X1 [Centropristis striata]